MSKFHPPDCERAENHRCRCWCGGEFHGITSGVYAKINGKEVKPYMANEGEILLERDMGGEIPQVLADFENKEFNCIGCNRKLEASIIRGYPHPNGYKDGLDRRWLAYVVCPSCHYATALWKIQKRTVQEIRNE